VLTGAARDSQQLAIDVGKWSPSARMNAVAAVSAGGLSVDRSSNSACLQQAAERARRDMTKIAESGIHSVPHCIALSFVPRSADNNGTRATAPFTRAQKLPTLRMPSVQGIAGAAKLECFETMRFLGKDV
jgi:hypothetical protein